MEGGCVVLFGRIGRGGYFNANSKIIPPKTEVATPKTKPMILSFHFSWVVKDF